jgi:glycosyltransferase involved in cell wall biosynthesis
MKYDFIYVGEITNRRIEKLIQVFTNGKLRDRSILIVSRNYSAIQKKFERFGNIFFTGPVEHQQVRHLLSSAKFGMNYIPNFEPFNRQTSTKLIEYAAARLPIITTNYPWLKNFKEKYGGKYFVMNDDLSNVDWKSIQSFPYAYPNLTEWTWQRQISHSGVLEFLQSRFPGINLISS